MNRLSPKALGIAVGVLWAVCILFMGVTAMLFGWGGGLVAVISSLYVGYGASVGGAVIGAVWAFFDGFIAGYVVAFVYNKIAA